MDSSNGISLPPNFREFTFPNLFSLKLDYFAPGKVLFGVRWRVFQGTRWSRGRRTIPRRAWCPSQGHGWPSPKPPPALRAIGWQVTVRKLGLPTPSILCRPPWRDKASCRREQLRESTSRAAKAGKMDKAWFIGTSVSTNVGCCRGTIIVEMLFALISAP